MLVWGGTIFASASMNYLAGQQFGHTPSEARVFALLGLSADVWKAIGPIFILTLWRARRPVPAGLAAFVWIFCFIFAVSAALGLAARNRSAVIGEQQDLRLAYQDIESELAAVEKERSAFGVVPSPAEKEAAIAAVFAQVVPGGTVGAVSKDCAKDTPRTRNACAHVALLRQDLERSKDAAELERRASFLRHKRDVYRARGARREADPQSRLIASLSRGLVPVEDVSLVLILVLVVVVELVSAFAPVVVHEFVLTMRSPAQPARRRQVGGHRTETGPARTSLSAAKTVAALAPKVGALYDYLAERIEPDETGILAVSDLWGDYHLWCGNQGFAALTRRAFISELDAIAAGDLRDCIFWQGSNYRGLRFVS